MVDQRDTAGAAKYRKFRISGADTNYRLDTVATFTENVAGFPEVPVGMFSVYTTPENQIIERCLNVKYWWVSIRIA